VVTRLAALAAIVFFLATAFRSGWRRAETDFPNYYTAAVMVRKGIPLREFYDWTSFQRQMNYAGVERQLGGFLPQTPVVALPLVELTRFPPQTAKRIWLVWNLGFLAATVWLLARLTQFSVAHMTLLAFSGFASLYTNFLYGQYYVFLLFLLTLAFYCLDRSKSTASGLLSGMTFALKLYGGPLFLYFVAKRNWRAAGGFVAAVACAVALAVALFGRQDVFYYATQILPRGLQGENIDPYNSLNGTFATFFRHLLLAEPELNPRPLWNAPGLFYFLQPFVSLSILTLSYLALARKRAMSERHDFAWFIIVILLLSVSTASYTYFVLLLPIALLLRDAELPERIYLIVSFVALTFPLGPGWIWMFPRLWVLLGLFLVVGRRYFRELSPKLVAGVLLGIAILSLLDARRQMVSYAAAPARRYESVAFENGAIFSSSPAVSKAGVFYQSMGRDRYVLRWLHDAQIEELAFEGHVFHPIAPSPNGPIYFELVAHGASTTMAFDPSKRRADPGHLPNAIKPSDSVSSPDGRWVAFESARNGPKQIWLRNSASGAEKLLTSGNCNSTSPAWELDSKAIIFASDCGRGIGLPALYRARLGGP
jgi:Glycosyltransferase family 87/WD40-like Beta Propeller Repeat